MNKVAKTYKSLALVFIILAFLWNMVNAFFPYYFYLDTCDMVRVSFGLLFILAIIMAKKHIAAAVLYGASALAVVGDIFVQVKDIGSMDKHACMLIVSCMFDVLVYVILICLVVKFGIKNEKHEKGILPMALCALPAVFSLISDLCNIVMGKLYMSPRESTVLSFIGILFLGLFYYVGSLSAIEAADNDAEGDDKA